MRFSTSASLLLLAGLALAEWKILPSAAEDYSPAERGLLVERDCFSGMTCSECFGKGNVICAQIACFNPTAGEQCCEDGSLCVARNNSCCNPLGPGQTGTDGVPLPTASLTGTATGTRSAVPTGSSWSCTRADTGEQCCSRGGNFMHWCSGTFPDTRCYNSSSQTCCSQGTVCEGEDCCDIVSAKPTTPYATATLSQSAKASTSSVATTKTTQTGTVLANPTTAAPTSSSKAGAVAVVTQAIGGVAAAAVGVIGLVLL